MALGGMPGYLAERAAEYEAELARNRRLFELARHNGYSTGTFHNGELLLWMVPEQLIPVAGCMAAVLA